MKALSFGVFFFLFMRLFDGGLDRGMKALCFGVFFFFVFFVYEEF